MTMAVSLVAILGFLALAIDVGMLMLARNELQNAADAAALAGAGAMYKRNDGTYEAFPNWTRARDSASNAVPYNKAMKQALTTSTIATGWWNVTGTPAVMPGASTSGNARSNRNSWRDDCGISMRMPNPTS